MRVAVGWVSSTEVSAFFLDSLLALFAHDLRGPQRLVGLPIHEYSSANISEARNRVAARFLDDTDADFLLTLDSDMLFEPSLVEDLLHFASPDLSPVVGGLYFGAQDGRLFPQLYVPMQTPGGPRLGRVGRVPDDPVVRVSATGAGCMLVHRSVLERVRAAESERGNTAWPWYQEGTLNGRPCSEDVTFCLRVGALGIPVYVATEVRLGHAKTYPLTDQLFRLQQEGTRGEDQSREA